MTRSEIIERIQALSEADLARVAPFIEADLDAAGDLDDLRDEVRRARESAATEPLLDDDEVLDAVRRRLSRKADRWTATPAGPRISGRTVSMEPPDVPASQDIR